MLVRTLFCFALLALFFVAPETRSQEKPVAPADLVGSQRGELPIILSAPHGGTKKIPGVPERTGAGMPKGGAGFSVAFDSNTDLLLLEVAAAIQNKFGKKPYYVFARFSRRYVDANRPPEIAYEDPKAKPIYEAYHDTLALHCRDVNKAFKCGLLLDIHGQGSARDTIFRGTQNGKTVSLLRERFGEKAHTGPKSFFGILNALEMKVHPTLPDAKERAGFTGGHIVQKYGSKNYGIDAIQLECGFDYRDKTKLKDVARNDRDNVMTQTYLTSDTGKVYTMLAHAAGRLR